MPYQRLACTKAYIDRLPLGGENVATSRSALQLNERSLVA
jgi:hypothetical protein